MKRVHAWKDEKVVELTLPEDSRHLWDSRDEWYHRIQEYDDDHSLHVDEVGDEIVGVKLLERAGLLTRDTAQHVLKFVKRPLTWEEARSRDEEEVLEVPDSVEFYPFQLVLIALILAFVVSVIIVNIFASLNVDYPATETPLIVYPSELGLVGPPGPPGMCKF